MHRRSRLIYFGLIISLFSTLACVNGPQNGTSQPATQSPSGDTGRKVKIGFSMATLKEERWQRVHER